MARKRRRTTQVKGHHRGGVYVKPHCRRPPTRRKTSHDKAKEWGF